MKNKKAFTLLELLVVVLIVGILASIALPQYRKVKDKAKYSTIMPIVKALGESMERYYMVHDSFPSTILDLDISLESTNIQTDSEGKERIFFDWGFCFLGRSNQASCVLEKEKTALSYAPLSKAHKCYSMDKNKNSRPYKFCANLPNSRLDIQNGTCRWVSGGIDCSSFFIN